MRPSRRLCASLLLTLFAAWLCCALSPADASPSPKRIVSLSPGITEILYALNLGARIAGDTNYCDYPPAAKLKPHIGDMVVNYEAVLALQPDLVIADAAANRAAIPRLQQLRMPVLVVTSNSLDDVERSISQIAAATGAATRAAAVLAVMNHNLRQASRIAAGASRETPLRTLVVIGTAPLYVAGNNSFMGDMVRRGGGIDLAGNTAYIPWSKEQAVASRPQAIFCAASDKASLQRDAAWRQTPAVLKGNLFVYSSDNSYMRPGPRLSDAAVAVATDLARARR